MISGFAVVTNALIKVESVSRLWDKQTSATGTFKSLPLPFAPPLARVSLALLSNPEFALVDRGVSRFGTAFSHYD